MTRLGTNRLRFGTQALLLHLGVILIVLVAGGGLVGVLLRNELRTQYEERALGVARSVAANSQIAHEVATGTPARDGPVQTLAEQVRRRTGALFVVITDDRGIRFSHPNRALVGQRVSTDPSEALAGREVVTFERGTLGESARGKVPLRTADGRVIGEVSVGIDAREVNSRLRSLLAETAAFGGVAMLLGALGSGLLVRRLKRQTLGLEPAEVSDLVREHEGVLYGVQDGVLAVDRSGRITVANDAATALLGRDVCAGADAATVLPHRLNAVVERQEPVDGVLVVVDERVLVTAARPVRRAGRDLGTVVTVRDRTDIEDLARELDVVNTIFDALRAQSHEYTNRLHAIAGMLQIGQVDAARDYVQELAVDPLGSEVDEGRVRDPYIRGLLAAKSAVASEHGVALRLTEDSFLGIATVAPLDAVTVLGNLVDNAVRAAAAGARRPAWVEVSLASDGESVHMAVTDSGDGVPDADVPRLFEDGFTTSSGDGRPHGLGLVLARQSARRHGGDVVLGVPRGPDHGAVFAVRMDQPDAWASDDPGPAREAEWAP